VSRGLFGVMCKATGQNLTKLKTHTGAALDLARIQKCVVK
jgi:hypothetical protein